MILINNSQSDPFFNIAAEEYLIKNLDEEVLMLWKSNDSVVVGKHQVTVAETNLTFTLANNIPVVRRFTGGGTVFHDEGNINFTVILKHNKPDIDFKKHTKPVIDFLRKLGLNAEFEGKNNIRVNELKVSGNAAHVFKNKTLYHGTLLFDSNLSKLKSSIKPPDATIETRAIQSIRSKTSNISNFIESDLSMPSFEEMLKKHLIEWYEISEQKSFSEIDVIEIRQLVEEKYLKDDWTFCYSPEYKYSNTINYEGHNYQFSFLVKRGEIVDVLFEANNAPELHKFFDSVKGMKHVPGKILHLLGDCGLAKSNDIKEKSVQGLLRCFF